MAGLIERQPVAGGKQISGMPPEDGIVQIGLKKGGVIKKKAKMSASMKGKNHMMAKGGVVGGKC